MPPSKPISFEKPLSAEYVKGSLILKDVLEGRIPIGSNDSFLSALTETGGNTKGLGDEYSIFTGLLNDAEKYGQLTIVGNRYRNSEQQQVLSNKSAGTLVLLMREPGNPKDPNAVACLMTVGTEPGIFTWRHVGYLPAHVAKELALRWPTANGYPMLVHTTLKDSKSVRIRAGVVYLTMQNQHYPTEMIRARDVSCLF